MISTQHISSLFRQHREKVYADALRICKLPHVAEDIVQDVFLQCCKNKERLSDIKDIPSWLFIITRNTAINHFTKQKREQLNLAEYTRYFKQIYPPSDDPVLDKEYHQLVQGAIACLPLRQRQVFLLCKEYKLKRKEVAGLLNISAHTVHEYLGIAVKKIQKDVLGRLG